MICRPTGIARSTHPPGGPPTLSDMLHADAPPKVLPAQTMPQHATQLILPPKVHPSLGVPPPAMLSPLSPDIELSAGGA